MNKTISSSKRPGKYYPLGFLFILVFSFIIISKAQAATKSMIIGPTDGTLSSITMGSAGSAVGIGTAPGSYTLNVNGGTNITGNLNITGQISGGSLNLTGALSSGNISAGQFGSNTGGGNYSFPASVSAPTFIGNLSGKAYYFYTADNRTIAPANYSHQASTFGFTSYNNNNTSPWADFIGLNSYQDASGGNDNLLVFNRSSLGMRLYQQGWNSASAFSGYKDIVLAENGASGNYLTKYSGTGNNVSVANSSIYDNGSVGIGTNNPLAKLNVANSSNDNMMRLDDTRTAVSGDFLSKISFNGYSGGERAYVGMRHNEYFGDTPSALVFGVTGSERMRINSSGNVGIGVTNPGYNLVVNGSQEITGTSQLYVDKIATDHGGTALTITGSSNIILNPSSGNVGIGKTPGTMLDVNGTVTALGFSGPMSGTLNAANVSAGSFGSNTGGGTYTFPSRVKIGSPSVYGPLNLKQDNTTNYGGIWLEAQNIADSVAISHDGSVGYVTTEYTTGGGTTPLELRTWNGASFIRLNTNGNVGIGTTNPSTKAHVYGTLTVDASGLAVNSYSEGIRLGAASNGYSIITFGANPSSATGAQANQWWIGRDGGDNGFNIWGNSPGSAFHILPSGNVGVGTVSPGVKLEIAGSIRGNQAGALRIDSGSGYIDVGAQNTSWAHLQTDRASFYFNKQIAVDGNLCKYGGNCYDINTIATHRGEGTNYVDYSRYVYNNGAYSGSGWTEPSDLGVRYANSAGSASSATNATNATNAGNADTVDSWHRDDLRAWGNLTGKPIGLVNMPDTGNAASSAWSLAWKNYGNHMIVDMSNSTAPNGTSHSNTNPEVNWTGSYPTLMGWNGSNTYGVRVDVSRYADSAGSAPANGGNADSVDGMHFAWSNRSNGPTYVWAADSYGDSYLSWVPGMSVSYANSAGSTGTLTGNAHTNGSDGWFRSNGQAGWYSESYGVGVYATQAGRVDLYNGASLYVPGNITSGSFIYNSSDRNLKKNIETIQNPLEKIMQLRGVTFNWKKDNTPNIGLVAQEVEQVFPELVTGTEGNKSVAYSNLVAPLIEAVKTQQQEIAGQSNKINNLNITVQSLNEQLKNLQKKVNKK